MQPVLEDRSEWMVSEDWEARLGLTNDIMHIAPANGPVNTFSTRFANEPIFKEVIEAIYNLDQDKDIWQKHRARHRAEQYIVKNGKL